MLGMPAARSFLARSLTWRSISVMAPSPHHTTSCEVSHGAWHRTEL